MDNLQVENLKDILKTGMVVETEGEGYFVVMKDVENTLIYPKGMIISLSDNFNYLGLDEYDKDFVYDSPFIFTTDGSYDIVRVYAPLYVGTVFRDILSSFDKAEDFEVNEDKYVLMYDRDEDDECDCPDDCIYADDCGYADDEEVVDFTLEELEEILGVRINLV